MGKESVAERIEDAIAFFVLEADKENREMAEGKAVHDLRLGFYHLGRCTAFKSAAHYLRSVFDADLHDNT